jgi:hypothetical protein
MTFPNLERARLVSDPTPGESMHNLLVLSHLIHDIAWHLGDQRGQQELWKVLEARLNQQFNRAACSRCVLSNTINSVNESQRTAGMVYHPRT